MLCALCVDNLRIVPHAGSIDSLSPESSPLRGFVYVARSRGSIPAGDITRRARGLANLRIAQSQGSIDSLSPERSPLRGFVYVARSRGLHFRRRQRGTKLSSLPSPCS